MRGWRLKTKKPGQVPYYLISARYAVSMRGGDFDNFPPVVLWKFIDGKFVRFICIDGWNRLIAAQMIGKTEFRAFFIKLKNYQDAYLEAIKRNRVHGANLSPAEVAMAIGNMKQMGLSYQRMKEVLSMPIPEIRTFERERLTWRKKGGRLQFTVIKSTVMNTAPPDITMEDQAPYSTVGQVHLLDQVINLIQKGHLDWTNPDVAKRIDILAKLLMGGGSPEQ
jgi:hypothetical protein